MTVDEFAEYWGLTKGSAQSYLCKCAGLDKINGHYIYDEKKIAKSHQQKLNCVTPKQENEFDFNDIYTNYNLVIGDNSLKKLVKSKLFPSYKRSLRADNNNNTRRLWDKKEVIEYFEKYAVKKKKMAIKTRKSVIEGDRANIIFFCTGRDWRYGESIKTNLHHVSYWNSIKD